MNLDPEAANGAGGLGRAGDPARDDGMSVKRWLDAATVRVSRRSYTDEPASGPAADALDSFCTAFNRFEGARTVLVRRAPPKIFTGWLLHVYGKVSSPSALVFVGDKRVSGAAAQAGFMGEAAVLEATALGFATCWIGGGVRRSAVETLLGLEPHEHVYSISALGYAAGPTLGERATAGLVKARKRKPLETIAPGVRTWPNQVQAGVEAARLAPSATNRQPWRFEFMPGPGGAGSTSGPAGSGAAVRIGFEGTDTPMISKRLDCGIAMLHFELGVRAAGAGGSWRLLSGNDVAAWDFAPTADARTDGAPREPAGASRPELGRRGATS